MHIWNNPEYPSENHGKNNLLYNLGVYSEAWKTSNILDVWQNSEYASVICYSLLGKTKGANKIDLVAM